jgi:hypothetical protein
MLKFMIGWLGQIPADVTNFVRGNPAIKWLLLGLFGVGAVEFLAEHALDLGKKGVEVAKEAQTLRATVETTNAQQHKMEADAALARANADAANAPAEPNPWK